MKISPVNLSDLTSLKSKISSEKSQKTNQNSFQFPNYRFYQSFLGGYTLDLKQTYQNLSKEQYPSSDILSMVEEEIKKPDSTKTLYDVHFEKYKKLLDCYSLEELKSGDFKKLFPELQDVLGEEEVNAQKGSFLDDYKCGEYEIFNNGEDLTLQLIKLYWGQGFSLSDLSNYIADNSPENKPVNLYYTMKKLNIPLMTPKYGNVLKLSNKEYNSKFTSEMSIKLKEAREARQQLSEGEAVVIPRGELSEAHKQHISEGLKKHFQAHPEKLSEMSERQINFYKENPQKREELSAVMDYAWNKTQEGRSIAKYLSKFMKKQSNLDIKPNEIGSQFFFLDKNLLKLFWEKNSWAKARFSLAVSKGWEYLKLNPVLEKNEPEIIESRVYPKKLTENIKAWAKKQGYDRLLDSMGKVFLFTKTPPYSDEEVKFVDFITDKYFTEFPKEADDMASSIQIGLISFVNDLYNNPNKMPDEIKHNKKKIETLKNIFEDLNQKINIYNPISQNGRIIRYPIGEVKSSDMFDFYCCLVEIACLNGCREIVKPLENKTDEAYFAIIQSKNGYPKNLREMLNIKI